MMDISKNKKWYIGASVVALIMALALINLQLWAYDTPPLIDWPNHLARHTLQCAEDPNVGIGKYYIYDLRLVPNLTSELIHTLRIACQSIELTQKILIQFSTIGLMVSTVLLHAAIWRCWSIWPALSAIIIHHLPFSYGFENFILAIPPSLLVLAVWFLIYEKPTWQRGLIMAPLMTIIYIFHLYAFIFLVLSVGFLEINNWWRNDRTSNQPWVSAFWIFIGAMGALMFPIIHTISLMENDSNLDLNSTAFGSLVGRLSVLLSPTTPYGTWHSSVENLIIAVFTVICLVSVPSVLRLFGQRVSMDPRCTVPAILLVFVCFLVPNKLSNVYLTEIRLPILVSCFILSSSNCKFSFKSGFLFSAILLIVFFAKVSFLKEKWNRYEEEVYDLRLVGQSLNNNDRLVVASSATDKEIGFYYHVSSYVAIDTGLYLPTLFTGGNSLKPRDEYISRESIQAAPVHIQNLINIDKGLLDDYPSYLKDWRDYYTHVLVLKIENTPEEQASKIGDLVRAGKIYELYEINPDL